MSNLRSLYDQHSGKVSDKWSIYLDEYDRIFGPYRSAPISFLEIGMQNGGSMEIWARYFQQAKTLIGCDIDPACASLTFSDPRIVTVIGDANSPTTAELISQHAPGLDIVIDDGSHKSSDIVQSFFRYFPKLNDGGIFIAEDLHCSYWKEFDGGLYDPYSSISFFKLLTDVINHEHWGIGKRSTDILRGFQERYDWQIPMRELSRIHSIEFINSMCILRKAPANQNVLGNRVIVGSEATVVPFIRDFSNQTSEESTLDQSSNDWSTLNTSPAEAWKPLTLQVEHLNERIVANNKIADDMAMAAERRVALVHARMSRREKTIGDLATELSHREKMIADLQAKVSSHEKAENELLSRLADKDCSIAELSAREAGQVGIIDKLQESNEILRSQHLKLHHYVQAVHQSTSWRLTSPMRVLTVQAKGLKQRLLPKAQTTAATPQAVIAPTHSGAVAEYRTYAEWVRRYDQIDDQKRQSIKHHIDKMRSKPLISVVMPTYNAKPQWLTDAIESVQRQLYPNWELCIADDASTNPEIRPLLESIAAADPRVRVVFREKNGHISAASNSALEIARGEWVALLDHDDLLPEDALYCVASAINANPQARLLYSDEDKISDTEGRHSPYFKSGWNLDLFYSQNLFSHLGVFHKELVDKVGGFRIGLEGSQDYDLTLRCLEQVDSAAAVHHIPRVLYHWRVHAESTAGGGEAKPYAALAGERALNEHFARRAVRAYVDWLGYGYRVRYALPEKLPLVSIIIPTRNAMQLVRRCIESILQKTTYRNVEIILVDNGSDDKEALAYFSKLEQAGQIKLLRDERPFNYSALNNAAVSVAKGDFVCLVNNDIEIITPSWLSEMVSIAIQPNVGAVGAKLLYPDGTLQHAGVVLGIGGVASHAHKHAPRESNGYFGRAGLISSFSAVTAACLLVRKSIYQEVGGLNERDLSIAFNDVDFCLKVRQAGYRNVWTPYAELYHHESATRGQEDNPEKQARFNSEVAYMMKQWAAILPVDPAYNVNLTLEREDFSFAWPPRIESFAKS